MTNISTDSVTALFEHMQTAIVITDVHLHILLANNAAEILLSTSKSQLLSSRLSIFFADDVNLPKLTHKALANQQAFSLTDMPLNLKTKLTHQPSPSSTSNSTKQLIDITVTPILTEQKTEQENAGSKLLFELRTKSLQAQIAHEAQQQQQLLIARQLIRGMAHEIKNPLASIRGAAQLMQQTTNELLPNNHAASELQDYTRLIIKEADRLKNLTDAMLGSHQLLKKEWINIHQPLEHVIHLIKSQFNSITLKKDYDTSLPDVIIDHDKLVQVFLNISLNAAQALTDKHHGSHTSSDDNTTPNSHAVQNPTIIFKTRICLNKVLQGKSHKQVIQVSIIDNGAGIPKHIQKTLFYPLVTTKAQGTGLGLSIAPEIIRQHGGMIDFHSHAGHTAFHVFLPLTS